MNERRKSERFAIDYPIIYVASNSDGHIETQGIGLALDISRDGMMLESNEPVDGTDVAVHASFNNGDTMKVNGFLVYSMPYSDGKYRSGIRFCGEPGNVSSFVSKIRIHS